MILSSVLVVTLLLSIWSASAFVAKLGWCDSNHPSTKNCRYCTSRNIGLLFVTPVGDDNKQQQEQQIPTTTTTTTTTTTYNSDENNELGLTPELQKLTNAFKSIADDKLRYKQLLFIANQLKPMDPSSQTPENKVRGCLSTVYIDGTTSRNEKNEIIIHFTGSSDGVLTKGLVALLVKGLSGSTASDIQKVNPIFIREAGIEASLTPGRNNGFLNMLTAMKMKATELEAMALKQESSATTSDGIDINAVSDSSSSSSSSSNGTGPIYEQMMKALQLLQPIQLELKDVSYQHAGHREVRSSSSSSSNNAESHFDLYIVSEAFDDLNLVKRHKLIYMILGEVMPNIHALQIQAKTPTELQQK